MKSLFGGLAAASLGGVALAQAAAPIPEATPATPTNGEIDAAAKAGLDQADTEFTQLYRRPAPPPHHRRPPPPRHRRPPPPHHRYRRPRRVVRNGRVYYVR